MTYMMRCDGVSSWRKYVSIRIIPMEDERSRFAGLHTKAQERLSVWTLHVKKVSQEFTLHAEVYLPTTTHSSSYHKIHKLRLVPWDGMETHS